MVSLLITNSYQLNNSNVMMLYSPLDYPIIKYHLKFTFTVCKRALMINVGIADLISSSIIYYFSE